MTNQILRPQFKPYRVAPSRASVNTVFKHCNHEMYSAYGSRLRAVQPGQPSAYPMFYYAQLLQQLQEIGIEFVTLQELCREPDGQGKIRLAIRHDIDGDIVAALEMARIENELGIPTSHYLLHTASYYMQRRFGRFRRHEAMGTVYREIESLGHEVGLHADGITVYQAYETDGAAAIIEEVNWLRSLGITIEGTVAHGSKAAFGAENYELFMGRFRGQAKVEYDPADSPEVLEHNGTLAMLRVVDEAPIGLTYEGNDIFRRRKEIDVEYGATRTVDGWRWRAYDMRLRDVLEPGGPPFCTQEEMVRDIRNLLAPSCIVMTIHPCYYGGRSSGAESPNSPLRHVQISMNRKLGWNSLLPGSYVSAIGPDEGKPIYHGLSSVNEFGMLDAEGVLQHDRVHCRNRILFLDGGMLDALPVSSHSHAHRLLEERLRKEVDQSTSCMKCAFAGMSISRLWNWLEIIQQQFEPTIVVLGVTSQELLWSDPKWWSQQTGFSSEHPPGSYLTWAGENVKIHAASSKWKRHQQKGAHNLISQDPRSHAFFEDQIGSDHSQAFAQTGALVHFINDAVQPRDSQLYLMVTEAGEHHGHFDAGASREKAYGQAKSVVQRWHEIAGRFGIPVISPYERFEKELDCPVHHDDGTWTAYAHRLAAFDLYDSLSQSSQLRYRSS